VTGRLRQSEVLGPSWVGCSVVAHLLVFRACLHCRVGEPPRITGYTEGCTAAVGEGV
jgi:hypothetical protein